MAGVRSLLTPELSTTANVAALLLAEAVREGFLNKVHLVQMTFSRGNRLCPLDPVVLSAVDPLLARLTGLEDRQLGPQSADHAVLKSDDCQM